MRNQDGLRVAARASRRGRRLAKPKIGPAQSLRDAAYEAIKHRIITLEFKPGEYINEAQLSVMLGIGRTPIHLAIGRLMLERQVEVIPRKGIIVKPLSLSDILEIIEIRLLIEGSCARRVAERASEKDTIALAEILEESKVFAKKRDVEQMMLCDRKFHRLLARIQGNKVVEDMLELLIERSLRFWFVSLNAPNHFESVQEEHDAILSAIHKRDADAAERAMRRHIESFRATLLEYLRQG